MTGSTTSVSERASDEDVSSVRRMNLSLMHSVQSYYQVTQCCTRPDDSVQGFIHHFITGGVSTNQGGVSVK